MTPIGLAQQGDLFVSIAPWLGILVVLIIVGGTVALWLKRRFLQQQGEAQVGFTLSDLRELARTGQISPEEFEIARSQMIARIRGSASTTVPDQETSSERRREAGSPLPTDDLDGMDEDSPG